MRPAALLLGLVLAGCGESGPQSAAVTQCLKDSGGDVAIPGGTMMMGARGQMPGEGPPRRVTVKPFRIDRTDVTNAEFAAFVKATGYVTRAEQGPQPSSLVFVGAGDGVDLGDPSQWWKIVPGADWRHPTGPDSSIDGLGALPVVHIAYEDALAYARWRGRDLPTEAEWEYAARGGLEGAMYVWGEERPSEGKAKANTWQGAFPLEDKADDGFRAAPAPVGCFPANGYGLYDMAGNVWQWTKDVWQGDLYQSPEDAPATASYDPAAPYATQRVIKGGSFLCADNYCLRYRPAARTAASAGDGASHIGFRTVLRDDNQQEASMKEGAP